MLSAPRICLVSASGQNVFFAEILEAFGAALSDHGLVVEESVDCFPALAKDLVYIYVPHEYHPLVHHLAHPTPVQLSRTVAVCTEQPGTQWFETSCGIAAQTGGVVDINALGAEEMRKRGIAATHAPLGYVPAWDTWRKAAGNERPIDLVFLGGHTERRAKVLARCASTLTQRRASIHLTESAQPHVVDSPYFFSHERKWRLLADSKVILNVHRDALAYMEWHRIIGAILNGCVVLSEHSEGVEPLEAGEHFVSADYADLHLVLESVLEDPERLDRIRHAAYDLVREEMPMGAAAEGLLQEVERAARNPVPKRRVEKAVEANVPLPAPPPSRTAEWENLGGDSAPLRMAVKHLVVHSRGLERRLGELTSDDLEGEDTVEHLGAKCANPRVSVLLTVYNYGDFVGEALRSVALGEFQDVEVVVVDDASTDDSAETIRRASTELPWLPVTLVRRSRNLGLPSARNLAMEHARADLLFILDADNTVMPQGLSKLTQALDDAPDAQFAYGIIQSFDIDGPRGVMSWLDWNPKRLRYGNFIDAMALIRRSALAEVGGYPTEPALYGWEDFAVWIAMASAGMRGVRVPDFVARYHVSSHSMLSLTDIDNSAAWAVLLRKYPFLVSQMETKASA